MKNSRLFQTLYLLMERQECTAQELAENLEVSVRTVYRDIDSLSAAGIPVYASKGRGGGIRLMKHFQLERSLLNEDAQEQILTSLQSLRAAGGADSSDVLTQLSALFRKTPKEWIDIDFESWGAIRNEKSHFEQCKAAILAGKLLSFGYYNSSGEQSRRTVEPYRLRFKGGTWYLFAFCLQKQDFRLFRLNRMEELVLEEHLFSPRPLPPIKQASTDRASAKQTFERQSSKGQGFEEQGSLLPPTQSIDMELLFSHKAAFLVMDSFPPQEITRLPDDTFLVRAQMPPGRYLVSFLLSFGSLVRVSKPGWLRDALILEAKEIQELYQI